MSVDFTALMDDRLDRGRLDEVPAILDAVAARLAAVMGPVFAREGDRPGAWEIHRDPACTSIGEQMRRDGALWIGGPWGFLLTIGAKLIDFHHWYSWARLWDVPEVAATLRGACRVLGQAVGGTTAIYVPDNLRSASDAKLFVIEPEHWIAEGERNPISAVEAYLLREFGPPPGILPGSEDHAKLTGDEEYFV
jgi:hypothetical protein